MSDSDQALDEQGEWLRVTLSSIGDAVITTDAGGSVTFLNPVAESLTGWKAADARGLPLELVFRIINEETRATVENPASRALREGLVVGLANHTLLVAKGGRERPIDDSAAPIRDSAGAVGGVVLIFRDITQRRAAEKALRESEERFRLLVEGVQDYAIFTLDPRGTITSWNCGSERITGYTTAEIIGKNFCCFYPPEAIAAGLPDREMKTAAAEGRCEDEGWRVRKDGSTFWADVIITALRDEGGKLKGFSKITRDLTQHHQMERARLQSEMLADLNRQKDEFLAMLSHELRNPLSPILNAVQLLRLQPDDDSIQEAAIAIIERQAAHLTRLVDDLLEVSRISTGTFRLMREQIDLRTVVERAVESVRSQIDARRHELSVSLGPESIWIHADATRIEEVIVNLLNNATKYSEEEGHIWLNARQVGQLAVLRVADAGVGIAPDLLPLIFDLFTQAERSLDRSQGGLGLGLAIVRRVTELHGGTVEAFSAGLGRGSEFVVRLPIAPSLTDNRVVGASAAAGRPDPKPRLLIVDDNRDSADTVAALLEHLGHEVRVEYSGGAAIAAAKEFQPRVILLDIGLPEMTGYEVARRLRQEPDLQSVWLIALTGYGQDADKRQCEAAGFDAHLVKPATVQNILDAVAAAENGSTG
ncbi:MAG TPA: PAS domain S-box protein [Pirellulales bacterium]|nr:PAS domain S-box protein [Pirellulales bacterium]